MMLCCLLRRKLRRELDCLLVRPAKARFFLVCDVTDDFFVQMHTMKLGCACWDGVSTLVGDVSAWDR